MKVTITQMKAPWPEGAGVGSVVELPGSTIPAWAAGKCKPAEDDAEAAFTWTPPAPPPAPATPAEKAAADSNAAILLDAANAALADMQQQLTTVTTERDAALARITVLEAELAAATKPKGSK